MLCASVRLSSWPAMYPQPHRWEMLHMTFCYAFVCSRWLLSIAFQLSICLYNTYKQPQNP